MDFMTNSCIRATSLIPDYYILYTINIDLILNEI